MKALAWLFAIATLMVALILGGFIAWGLSEGLPPGSAITIDGERFVVADIAEALRQWWPAVALVVLVIAAAIVIVLPIAIGLAVGVPLLGGALSIAVALLALSLVVLPLVLLVRWLWQRSKPRPTTIAA